MVKAKDIALNVIDGSKKLRDMSPEVRELFDRMKVVINDRKYSDNDVLNCLMNHLCQIAWSIQVTGEVLKEAVDTTMTMLAAQAKPDCGHPECERAYAQEHQIKTAGDA